MYDPIPQDVREAWATLRDLIHQNGWTVTGPLIHTAPDSLEEGEDRNIRVSPNGPVTHTTRYWPSCGAAPGELIICSTVTK